MGLLSWLKGLLAGGAPASSSSAVQSVPTLAGDDASRPVSGRPPRGDVRLEGLDAAQFAPLEDSELRQQARALGPVWNNPWVGRRDLIPPASDDRTRLIDRGMVAQGLVTPEELVAIHEIGVEMDRIRPDLAWARQQADAAVARSAEEREQRKQQKRAEAAERRRERAEAVARRRATDIDFLGRGVSRDLADRRANIEQLEAAGLPVLATPADVAAALELSIPRLRWLAWHSEASSTSHYVSFTVPKKSGGVRRLSAPRQELRCCQSWIFEHILQLVDVHPAAHGFVKQRSTLTNAEPHVRQEVLVNTDLADFFPTITFPRVSGVFRSLGYSPAAATILALLCTESPRQQVEFSGRTLHVASGPRQLPQGACTSPALSNLICRRLDSRLSGLTDRLEWVYTRYADDATFSATGEAAERVGYLLARVRHICADEGFQVNERKTRVLRRNSAQTVTGLVVNQQPAVPRKIVRRLRAILHDAGLHGLEAANREQHPNFSAWLHGMVAYISMVQPDLGERFGRQLRQIEGGFE